MRRGDAAALKKDPVACLKHNVVKTDEMLFAGELGKVAMTCGTTSTVVYMQGADCWTACSGDSRAVKASGARALTPLAIARDRKSVV